MGTFSSSRSRPHDLGTSGGGGGFHLRAAFHEAGHAVVAIVTGIGVSRLGAKIWPDDEVEGEYLGLTRLASTRRLGVALRHAARGTVRPSHRDILERLICTHYAGPLAEHRFTGQPTKYLDCVIGVEEAALIPMGANAEEDTAYERWLTARTDTLIDRYWTVIDAVALRLLPAGKLSGSAIEELVANADAFSTPGSTGGSS